MSTLVFLGKILQRHKEKYLFMPSGLRVGGFVLFYCVSPNAGRYDFCVCVCGCEFSLFERRKNEKDRWENLKSLGICV